MSSNDIWPQGEGAAAAPAKNLMDFATELVSRAAEDPDVNTNELLKSLTGATLLGSRCDDTSNAERFASMYGEVVRFAWRPGSWLTWEETRWFSHADGRVNELAKNVD